MIVKIDCTCSGTVKLIHLFVRGTSCCHRDPVTSFRYNSDKLLHLFSQTIHEKQQQMKRGKAKQVLGINPWMHVDLDIGGNRKTLKRVA